MSAKRDLDPSSDTDTLQLLIGGGGGDPETLLVIERPDSDGRVHVRSWTSDDWSAAPRNADRQRTELLRELEQWSRAGRSLSQPLGIVKRWLG